ncbi:porphobilinogen deaminase-like [Patiria miniata]|uniref:hydroxymethylbilane synthase n=1 Tax=Patiria miniata TaxID=46514 RepID=A0A914AQU9_PATMI|nr:porphobilinogen deaminase-like [Patiria miniata]
MADEIEGEVPNVIRVGSRKSELALIQTNTVIERLQELSPDQKFEVVTMETIGDTIQDKPLSSIGISSLFTKELERALADDKIDMIVHSLKDLPSVLPDGMVIATVCKRDDPHDALVLSKKHAGRTLETLPPGSVVGTSSVRRVAQLKRKFPHLEFKDVRGNLNTRLRKLDEGDNYTCLILAAAGLHRMAWEHRISQVLHPDVCMYSPCQGAMATECRSDNPRLMRFLSTLHDPVTLLQCVCERALLRTLQGGCSAPVAADSQVADGKIRLRAAAFSLDGSECVEETQSVALPPNSLEKVEPSDRTDPFRLYSFTVAPNLSHDALQAAEQLGSTVATAMLKNGADKILEAAKQEIEARRNKQD